MDGNSHSSKVRRHVGTECSDAQALRPPLGYTAQHQVPTQYRHAAQGGSAQHHLGMGGSLLGAGDNSYCTVPRHLLISPFLFLAVAGDQREGHHERREEEEQYDQIESGIVMSNFLLYNENESDRVAPP